MNGLKHRATRRPWLWGGAAAIVLGVCASGVVAWRTMGANGEVTFTDVVGAVLVRGKVFHIQCAPLAAASTKTTFEQWYSPDLGATRSDSTADGKPQFTRIVAVNRGIDVLWNTRTTSAPARFANSSPLPLGQPELSVVHIGSLGEATDPSFVTTTGANGRKLVEATAHRLRPQSEAGEDEPAGDLQTTTWTLDAGTLLPLSVHFVETHTDGTVVFQTDNTCTTAEMLDAAAVDPALFDIDALKRQASAP